MAGGSEQILVKHNGEPGELTKHLHRMIPITKEDTKLTKKMKKLACNWKNMFVWKEKAKDDPIEEEAREPPVVDEAQGEGIHNDAAFNIDELVSTFEGNLEDMKMEHKANRASKRRFQKAVKNAFEKLRKSLLCNHSH
ncbi:hypothetical protein M9H77_15784 [Catharanthus roseus]|uniref:Uncharacterized protein n=1 Tax=Catharanthus roseus TaxID=4058 RepID=A0ACC0AZ96_CATRO|nr:hypothetical protein M9H77_15784 [Catharanthus roseus]